MESKGWDPNLMALELNRSGPEMALVELNFIASRLRYARARALELNLLERGLHPARALDQHVDIEPKGFRLVTSAIVL